MLDTDCELLDGGSILLFSSRRIEGGGEEGEGGIAMAAGVKLNVPAS